MSNPYEILGISQYATDTEIKKTYHKLAKQYHPDKNQGNKDAENKFKEIKEAYETLSDSNKRNMYNLFGNYANEYHNQTDFENINDIFNEIYGDIQLDTLFSELHDVLNRHENKRPETCENSTNNTKDSTNNMKNTTNKNIPPTHVNINAKLEDIYNSVHKTIKLKLKRKINELKLIEEESFHIPLHCVEKCFPNMGHYNRSDLIFKIHHKKHDRFKRIGLLDLLIGIDITLKQFSENEEINFKHLDESTINIFPNGKTFHCLSNLGLPSYSIDERIDNPRGDLYVYLNIVGFNININGATDSSDSSDSSDNNVNNVNNEESILDLISEWKSK